MAGYLISRAIFAKGDGAAAAAAVGSVALSDGSDIQKFLQRILDQTAKLESISLDKATPATAAHIDAQVQSLKLELKAKEDELNKAKASGDHKISEDAEKLNARIKELEGKLAEYEILEDDIADLSLYKEENARLRTELDKVKGHVGGPAPVVIAQQPAPDMAAAPLTPPVASAAVPDGPLPPAPQDPGEDIVAEFSRAVGADTSSSELSVEIKETGDPMKDFEAAIRAEKKVQRTEAPPPAAPQFPLQSAKPPEAVNAAPDLKAVATPPAESAEADDLFAEFAKPPEDEDNGSLDTEKMMAEMAALVGMEPAKDNALDDNIDTEKMAKEASNFGKS